MLTEIERQLDQNSSSRTTNYFSEDAEIISHDRLSLHPEVIDLQDHQVGPDAGTRTSCGDRNHWSTDVVSRQRISQGSAYRVVMYVMAATGLIVMYVPFLTKKDSAKTFTAILYIVRNVIMTLLMISSLIGVIWLTMRVGKLHELGMMIWPRRCKHCSDVFLQVKFPYPTVNAASRNMIHISSMKEMIDNNMVSNVTLNITYIFCGLTLISFIPELTVTMLCFNEHSPHNLTAQTNEELIMRLLNILTFNASVYTFTFYFIPTFKDVHFVSTPKIWWPFVLLTQVAIWTSIQKLLRPFTILANGENRTPYPCPMNSTLGEVLHGITDILEPFTSELPVMVTLLMIEILSQNIPKRFESMMNDIGRSAGYFKCITPQSNWITLRDFTDKTLNRRYLSQCESERSLLLENYIEMECVTSMNARSDDSRTNSCLTSSYRGSDKTLREETEKVLSMTLLMCTMYFGISHYLSAQNDTHHSIYTQWLLKIAFFTPLLLVIIKHAKVTKKDNRIEERHCVDSIHNPSEINNIMLLISLSGACLFDMFCFVSSLGNLVSGPGLLSHDEMVLNLVSVFSCVFGLLCKCIQSTFILKVEHQQPKDYQEMRWTSLCLLAVGMVNATQWLLDSLTHEEEWPVLSMFFEGNVGLVIGMIFVPFLHLYELHIAIMASEVHKYTRSEK